MNKSEPSNDACIPAVRARNTQRKRTPEELESLLCLCSISKTYGKNECALNVLSNVDLLIQPGETVALIGPSGSGKSTLLHIAGLLEQPTSGRVMLDGYDVSALTDGERTGLRRCMIGFVYQSHRLLPEFSALENIILPQRIAGLDMDEARQRAEQLLSMLGLSERRHHRPAELSGGEQQRIAIARAVANAPRLLLADEPTGNLDSKIARHVFKILLEIVRQSALSALIATHDLELARLMDRRIMLVEGTLREE